ncbi:hypothetical protein HPG69_006182 [Diceros bicornis minor]|uniref:Uncharacterized protein n=1 Tax=Diceros bicornis minor TaxID=77932 RepID=A0A7J7EYV0_DICBM|nr:hypothetical protein HPG69_006182 [Diceros bicornis minor]
MKPEEGAEPLLQPPPREDPTVAPSSLVIAVLVDNFQMALLRGLEKVKQEVPSGMGQVDQSEKREEGGTEAGGKGGGGSRDGQAWDSGRIEASSSQRAAQIHEKLLDDSLTELRKAEPEEEMGEHAIRKQLMEKKFGTMTEK